MEWDEIIDGAEKRSALRFLGPLAPAALRRAERVERVAEEISRATVIISGNLPKGDFDPTLGASGRPQAVFELAGGAPTLRHVATPLNRVHHWGEMLVWSGDELFVEEGKVGGNKYTLPLASSDETSRDDGRYGSGTVAEVALFAQNWNWASLLKSGDRKTPERIYQGSLHFLNAQGYAVCFVPEVDCLWQRLIDVVTAAGLPFNAYMLACPQKTAEEIAEQLFPRRRHCVKIHH
jgi:hypothetical protein